MGGVMKGNIVNEVPVKSAESAEFLRGLERDARNIADHEVAEIQSPEKLYRLSRLDRPD
jgi:hypothetical protein